MFTGSEKDRRVIGHIQAEIRRQAALDAGLRNVRIGNRHLLGHEY